MISEEGAKESGSEAGLELKSESLSEEPVKTALHEIEIALPVEPASQDELSLIAKRHGEWLRSVLDPRLKIAGGRANFSGATIKDLTFEGLHLAGASFCQSHLENIDFSGANLTGTDFSGSLLTGCRFVNVRLRRSRWTDSVLKDCFFF